MHSLYLKWLAFIHKPFSIVCVHVSSSSSISYIEINTFFFTLNDEHGKYFQTFTIFVIGKPFYSSEWKFLNFSFCKRCMKSWFCANGFSTNHSFLLSGLFLFFFFNTNFPFSVHLLIFSTSIVFFCKIFCNDKRAKFIMV